MIPRALAFAGIGVLAPAAFYAMLRLGLGTSWAASAAAVLSLALASLVLARLKTRGGAAPALASASAAAFASGTAILPLRGERHTELLAVLLLLVAFLLDRREAGPARGSPPRQPWTWGLAAGAAAAWTRCLALTTGNPVYAWAWVFSALALGAALGLRVPERWKTRAGAGGAAILAGLFGLFILHFLRFIGFNRGAGEYILAPMILPFDLLFIAGQAYAVLAVWAALLAASAGPAEEGGGNALAFVPALWGPALAAVCLPRLGPAGTVVLFSLLSIGRGLARLRGGPKISAAVAALCAWLCLGTRGAFEDIWTNRLNAVYPGGRFLALQDDGTEALGVYRFSTGKKFLVRDGAAEYNGGRFAKREAHLPLLLRDAPRRALFLGTRSPVTLDAALSHGIHVDVRDPHPAFRDILSVLADKPDWRPPEDRVTFGRGGVAGARRLRSPSYDLILVELPVPAQSPAAALSVTLGSVRDLRARLNPGGILAVRLAPPFYDATLRTLARTLGASFAHSGLFDLPGGAILCASDAPLDPSPAAMAARMTTEAWADDPDLPDDLRGGLRWVPTRALTGPGAPQTDGRAYTGFPLGPILRGRRLRLEAVLPAVDGAPM